MKTSKGTEIYSATLRIYGTAPARNCSATICFVSVGDAYCICSDETAQTAMEEMIVYDMIVAHRIS